MITAAIIAAIIVAIASAKIAIDAKVEAGVALALVSKLSAWKERHVMRNNLTYSAEGAKFTEDEEGLRLVAYPDQGGVSTIGWGHTGPDVYPGLTWTLAQAQAAFLHDSQWAQDDVNNYVDSILTQGEFDALVDFVFNAGGEAFKNSTMLKLLNQGNYKQAAQEFAKWDHVGGQIVAGLLRRRDAEKQEFNS